MDAGSTKTMSARGGPSLSAHWQFDLRRMFVATATIGAVLGLGQWLECHFVLSSFYAIIVGAVVMASPRVRRTLALVLACAYLPYIWILWYPWANYPSYDHWLACIEYGPFMPAVPLWTRYVQVGAPYIMATCTLAMLTTATAVALWRRWHWPVAIVVLILSAFNSWDVYFLFQIGIFQ